MFLPITVDGLPFTENGTQLSDNGLSRFRLSVFSRSVISFVLLITVYRLRFTVTTPGRLRKRPYPPKLTPTAALALSWGRFLLLPFIIFLFLTGLEYSKASEEGQFFISRRRWEREGRTRLRRLAARGRHTWASPWAQKIKPTSHPPTQSW